MITLTVKNLKTKKTNDEVYISLDKAKERLESLSLKSNKKTYELIGASFDTKEEKKICLPYLPPFEEEDEK